MLPTVLVDGHGSGHRLKINGEGELNAVLHQHPPRNEDEIPLPYRQYLTDTGYSDGDNDMRVNGSSSEIPFLIKADPNQDVYLKTLAVVIADAGATLNNFGNIGALSNGIKFEWNIQESGAIEIHEGLKSNWDFVRLSGGNPSFGQGTSSFRANNVSGNSEGYIPTIDLQQIYGLQWGLRLRAGTNDNISFTIRDNITGVDQFDIIAYGIKF